MTDVIFILTSINNVHQCKCMQATIMSDTGSYRSDTEDAFQRTVTPARDMVSCKL